MSDAPSVPPSEPPAEPPAETPAQPTARPAPRRARRSRWSDLERAIRASRGPLIAGIDEVGRGPLAGPVVACAVVMPPDARAIAGVDDSKRLTAAERERLERLIRRHALAVAVGAASAREIDRLNIYHATVLAMRRALARLERLLGSAPHHVILDGKPIRTLGVEHTAVVGGDAKVHAIACASIVAKVTRDRLMTALARRRPGYAWERNAGYATAAHRAGLTALGMTPHHRRSFLVAPQVELDLEDPTGTE
ncbi:ribonuclease HII [Gemmatirosa kalamazoonensis]|uniref:ribonuclease HII n=1 Tax=Gemmatirosa kalamazoonensis TaxID=861299 RepID=UPI00046D8EBA|nr:ribonuclease HII [Gemmatirosa kalamazoonensis]